VEASSPIAHLFETETQASIDKNRRLVMKTPLCDPVTYYHRALVRPTWLSQALDNKFQVLVTVHREHEVKRENQQVEQ